MLRIPYTGKSNEITKFGLKSLIPGRIAAFIPKHETTNPTNQNIIIYPTPKLILDMFNPLQIAAIIDNIVTDSPENKHFVENIKIKFLNQKFLTSGKINLNYYKDQSKLFQKHEITHLQQEKLFPIAKLSDQISKLTPPKIKTKDNNNLKYLQVWNDSVSQLTQLYQQMYPVQEIHAIVKSFQSLKNSKYQASLFFDQLLLVLLQDNPKKKHTLSDIFYSLSFDTEETKHFGIGLTHSRHAIVAIVQNNPKIAIQNKIDDTLISNFFDSFTKLTYTSSPELNQKKLHNLELKSLKLMNNINNKYFQIANKLISASQTLATEKIIVT